MKGRKRPWELFRLLVVPTMFLCAIVQHPATKAVAIVALVIWLGCLCSYFNSGHEPKSKEAREAQRRKDEPMDAIVHELPQEDVFLLRQINFRITEMIKQVYPTVSWLWVRRPGVEEGTSIWSSMRMARSSSRAGARMSQLTSWSGFCPGLPGTKSAIC